MSDAETTLITRANELAFSWKTYIQSGIFRDAAEIAISGIRETHESPSRFQGASARALYGVRVLLNGLRDIANLRLVTSNESWIHCPRAVESAWCLSHDANERLSEHNGISDAFRVYCLSEIESFWGVVRQRFGDGAYNSIELSIEQLTCTICGADLRGCLHEPGKWYDDRLCQSKPEGLDVLASAIVDNPRDPRCRIWPWQIDKGARTIRRLVMLNSFNSEGEENGGAVVDISSLFPSVCTTLQDERQGIKYEVYAYRKVSRKELKKIIQRTLPDGRPKAQRGCCVRICTTIGHDE